MNYQGSNAIDGPGFYREFERVLKFPEGEKLQDYHALSDDLYDLSFFNVNDTNGVVLIIHDCSLIITGIEEKFIYLVSFIEDLAYVVLLHSDTSICYSGGAPDFIHALPFHVVFHSSTGDFTRTYKACEENHLTTHYVKHLTI